MVLPWAKLFGALICAGAVQHQHSQSVFLQTRDSSLHNEVGSIAVGGSDVASPMHDVEFGDIRLQYAAMAGMAAETVLNEAGYQSVAKLENSTETVFFVRRLLNTMDLAVATGGAERLRLFAANYSGENGTSTHFDSLKQEIRRLSRVPQSWVSQTGSSAALNEEGFAVVSALGRSSEMSRFVHRVAAELLDKRITDAKKLSAFVSFYDGKLARRDFNALMNDLRTVLLDDIENFLAPAHEPLRHAGEDCRSDCKKTGLCQWCGAGNACCREKDMHSPQECKVVLNEYLTSSSECMEVASGSNAPMSQVGYEATVKLKNNTEMQRYFLRLADDLDYDVISHSSLMGVVPFYSGMKGVRSFGALVEELGRATSPRNGTTAWLLLRPESERQEKDSDDEDEVAMFLKARDGGDTDEEEALEKLGRKRRRQRRHKRRESQPKMSAAEKALVLGINKDSVDAEDDEMQIALGLKDLPEGQEEAFDYAAAAQGSQEAVKKTAKVLGTNAASLTEEEKELALALALGNGSEDIDLEAGDEKGESPGGRKLAVALGTNAGSLSEEEEEMAVALGLKDGPEGGESAKEGKESAEEVKMVGGKQLAAALGADLGSVSAEEDEMAIALGLKDAPEDSDPEKGAVMAAEKTRGEELAVALGRDKDAGTLSEEEGEMAIALGLIEPPSERASQALLGVNKVGGEEIAAALGADPGSLSEEEEEMAIALGVKPPPETKKDENYNELEDATKTSASEGQKPEKADVMASILGTEVGSMTEEQADMAVALGLQPAKSEQVPAKAEVASLAAPAGSSKMEELAAALGSDAGTLSEEEEEMAVALGRTPAASVGKRRSHAEVIKTANAPEEKTMDMSDLADKLHADSVSLQHEEEDMAIALGKRSVSMPKGLESSQNTSGTSSQGTAPHSVDLASALGISGSAVEEEEAEMAEALGRQSSRKIAGHHVKHATEASEHSLQKIDVITKRKESDRQNLKKGTQAQEVKELSMVLGEKKTASQAKRSSSPGSKDKSLATQNALAPDEGPNSVLLVKITESSADIAKTIGTDIASVTEEAEMMAIALGEKPAPKFENGDNSSAAEDVSLGQRGAVDGQKGSRATATQKAKSSSKSAHEANSKSLRSGHAVKARQHVRDHGSGWKASFNATKGAATVSNKGKKVHKRDMPQEAVSKHDAVLPKATELPHLSMMAEEVDEQDSSNSSLRHVLSNRDADGAGAVSRSDHVEDPRGDDLASALAAAAMAQRAVLGATHSTKSAELPPLSMIEDASAKSESPRSYAPLNSAEKTLDQFFAGLR